MGVTLPMLGRAALCSLLLASALLGPARAEPTEAERMTRWSDLKHTIFGDRVVEAAGDLVAIDAPARAEDAAIVRSRSASRRRSLPKFAASIWS